MMKKLKWVRKKYFILFITLILINLIEFGSSFKKESFFRLKYDLSKTQTIHNLGNISLKEINYNKIVYSKNENLKLSPKKHYKINFGENGDEYIFTFDSKTIKNNEITLNYVVWFFSMPLKTSGLAEVEEVKLYREEKGNVKTAMITEELGCCLMNGRSFRLKWNKLNESINFVGNQEDVYGYKFYGGENFNSEKILSLSSNIESADVYIIWAGRNNLKTKSTIVVDNLKTTINNIKEKNKTAQILLIYPAPSPIKKIDKGIESIVNLLNKEPMNGVIKLDINKEIKNTIDWEKKMFKYNYGLSDKAYKMIIKKANDALF